MAYVSFSMCGFESEFEIHLGDKPPLHLVCEMLGSGKTALVKEAETSF